jgi:hypothetical protein
MVNFWERLVQSLYYFGHAPLVSFVSKLFSLLKHKVVHILACLSRLDAAVIPNAKSGRVRGSSTSHFQVTI